MSAKQASNATSANRVQSFVGNVVNGFEIIKLSGKHFHSFIPRLNLTSLDLAIIMGKLILDAFVISDVCAFKSPYRPRQVLLRFQGQKCGVWQPRSPEAHQNLRHGKREAA